MTKLISLFLGNYFGGDIATTANALLNSVKWSDAIKAADNPRIYPVVNSETGEFSGNISIGYLNPVELTIQRNEYQSTVFTRTTAELNSISHKQTVYNI